MGWGEGEEQQEHLEKRKHRDEDGKGSLEQ